MNLDFLFFAALDLGDSVKEVRMGRFSRVTLPVLFLSVIALTGCQDLVPHDTQSILDPNLKRSEILGLVAGFGTTFAAVPDLIAMF